MRVIWDGLKAVPYVLPCRQLGATLAVYRRRLTTSVTFAVCCVAPLVPVTVTVKVPLGVVVAVVTLSVEDPPTATVAGVKVAVAFAGRPLAVNVMLPANPLSAAVFTV